MTCGIPVLVSSKHHRHRVFEFRDLRHRLSSPLILLADRVGQIHTLHKPVRCQVSVLGATKIPSQCLLLRLQIIPATAYELDYKVVVTIVPEAVAQEAQLRAHITIKVAEDPVWELPSLGQTTTTSIHTNSDLAITVE